MQQHHYEIEGQESSNVLGIVGFVLSLTLCLGPVGFIVSIFGLLRKPRAFAVAGVCIGLLGFVLWAMLIYGGMMVNRTIEQMSKLGDDVDAIHAEIESYQQAHDGVYPASLEDLSLSAEIKSDPWGTAYGYRVSADGRSFYLSTAGRDGQWNTGDDLTFDRHLKGDAVIGLSAANSVMSMFGGEKIRDYMQGGAQIISFKLSLEEYADEAGSYPPSLEALPGYDAEDLKDPWGNPYDYTVHETGRRYTLRSAGLDGALGTDDDLDAEQIKME